MQSWIHFVALALPLGSAKFLAYHYTYQVTPARSVFTLPIGVSWSNWSNMAGCVTLVYAPEHIAVLPKAKLVAKYATTVLSSDK